MILTNDLHLDADVTSLWPVLTDIERVAPCLPGALLTGSEEGAYRGHVTVRVGPMKLVYGGTVRFTEIDADRRTMVLAASGRDSRGQGTASATSNIALAEDGAATVVTIETDLQITGKVAQFGRSALADISDRLLAEFAANLLVELQKSQPRGGVPAGGAAESKHGTIGAHGGPASLNLVSMAGPAMLRTLARLAASVLFPRWLRLGRYGARVGGKAHSEAHAGVRTEGAQ